MTERFEDRLLTELKQVVAEREPVRPAPRWRPVAVAAALVVAAGTAVQLLFSGGGAAYALEEQQDGTVRVEIKELSDAAGLQRRLAELGIKAKVDYLPAGKTCRAPRFTPMRDKPQNAAGALSTGLNSSEAAGTAAVFTFNPADFTGDRSVVIETSGGGDVSGLQVSFAEGPVGACVPVPVPPGHIGNGSGGGGSR
ncbi:hypothetical protein [Allokutzneria albata]|uniref:Uncharacterized protein n=1 Tax=Allokutzneria albata TaxID=211114 RepID=A0A1H0BNK7_ALLAB|nr:hypothetical protein [Allokutzneria albata]SDN47152.1 hypothetical protein SAMN04489726_6758 [Allokutzneria albata]